MSSAAHFSFYEKASERFHQYRRHPRCTYDLKSSSLPPTTHKPPSFFAPKSTEAYVTMSFLHPVNQSIHATKQKHLSPKPPLTDSSALNQPIKLTSIRPPLRTKKKKKTKQQQQKCRLRCQHRRPSHSNQRASRPTAGCATAAASSSTKTAAEVTLSGVPCAGIGSVSGVRGLGRGS